MLPRPKLEATGSTIVCFFYFIFSGVRSCETDTCWPSTPHNLLVKKLALSVFFIFIMPSTGIEQATKQSLARRSKQLSYATA